jgi:chaperonin GroES
MAVLQPTEDRLLVKPIEASETTRGGIVLPASATAIKNRGVVVAAGYGRYNSDGVRLPMTIEVGQTIQFSSFGAGEPYTDDDGEDFIWMRQSDVLAVVREA